MIFTSILILIVAKALPSINRNLSSIYFTRISAIIFIYAGVLSLNTFYIQSIGSGIGIYSGLFQITQVSVLIESFLLIIGSLILISWPSLSIKSSSSSQKAATTTATSEAIDSVKSVDTVWPMAKAKAASSQWQLLSPSLGLQREPEVVVGLANKFSSCGDSQASTQVSLMVAKSQDYSLIVLFSSLGSCLLISCFDLVSLYISIELQSFGLYVLSTLYKDSETSTKAGLKYFLLGGLSSCIILLGCGIIYSYTGLTNFESIYSIISTSNSVSQIANNLSVSHSLLAEATVANAIALSAANACHWQVAIQGLSLGLIFIFIGFLFKIAAAPLHNWSPDVYDEVPTIVTIWITIIPKIAILVLLLELQYYGFTLISISSEAIGLSQVEGHNQWLSLGQASSSQWVGALMNSSILKNLLLISSVLSLVIGTVVGLAQTRIKRLLAYSTISHIGFILLALAINSESSIDSLIFYIIQYTITNLNIFLIIIALSYSMAAGAARNKEIRDIRFITELTGKFSSNPILSLSLAICLFSMAGIPPLIGFFSKQFVLYSAIQNGYGFISVIAILVSVISASYYLKIVKVIYTTAIDLSNKNQASLSDPEAAIVAAAVVAKRQESSSSLACSKVINSLDSSRPDNQYYAKGKNSLATNATAFNDLISNVHSYVISMLTLAILLFFLKPSLILNSTQLLSLSLFNW